MYCRKCGAQISDSAKFCDKCGAEVVTVKQRTYSEKYADQKKKDKEARKKYNEKKREEKIKDLKNPYVFPAIGCGIVALLLAFFPFPKSWGVGTSIWMRILIVALALLADYHCTKAKQVNNLYEKQYHYQIQPNVVRLATVISVFVTVISLFALFYM